MRKIDRDLDWILGRLRDLIRERGFTQLEVQEVLGWGRNYIGQLLNRQKSLRVDQVLLILNVIDVKPESFFADVYMLTEPRRPHGRAGQAAASLTDDLDAATPRVKLRRLRKQLDGLVSLLEQKALIDSADLDDAIEKARSWDRVFYRLSAADLGRAIEED